MRNLKEALAKVAAQMKVNLCKADLEGKMPPNIEAQIPFRNSGM